MKLRNRICALLMGTFSFYGITQAQEQPASTPFEVHGNFQLDAQYYNPDSTIGAPPVPEKVLMNGFGNINLTKGRFSAGLRYENYSNVLLGFDPRYQGSGIPYRYIQYKHDGLDITLGNYYEQFGSGMIFRSYEERQLGVDNAMEGARIKYSPVPGVYIKGIIGWQRTFFSRSEGIVRGADGELAINEAFKKLAEKKTKVIIGGSFVSKYQDDQDPIYILPENVAAGAGRINIIHGGFNFFGEYAYKINDPQATNNYIYKNGEGVFVSASYSQKGLGVILSAKRIDNMDFRSDRNAVGNNLNVNFLPPLTKQHTYQLAATLYPYGVQPNGEMALQAEVTYNIKRGSKLGGKYGTSLTVNYSAVNGLDTTTLNNGLGYESDYLSTKGQVYFRDFNVELKRKLSKSLKLNLNYLNLVYNKDVIQGLSGYGTIYANIGIIDILYKVATKHSLRLELQHLWTNQDEGDWAMALLEYNFAPHFFVAVMDQYNYSNPVDKKQLHYPIVSTGYTKDATRFMVTYGRQRAGIFCVGGVCRNVPASNGVALSITTSF